MKYLLDTTAYSELLRGHKHVASLVETASELLIPQVVIAELRYGFQLSVQLSSHNLWIAALAEQWQVTLVSFDKDFKHLAHTDLMLWSSRN